MDTHGYMEISPSPQGHCPKSIEIYTGNIIENNKGVYEKNTETKKETKNFSKSYF